MGRTDQQGLLGPPASGASLSGCGRFRYGLWRAWGEQKRNGSPVKSANFIMLNPSTADAMKDDPTIRRCIGFARRWLLDGITVTNLYPLRATNPSDLWKADDRLGERVNLPPDGPHYNDSAIIGYAESAAIVVCAWGVNAEPAQADHVLGILRDHEIPAHCLGVTKDGHPRHPLYLPKHVDIREFLRVERLAEPRP